MPSFLELVNVTKNFKRGYDHLNVLDQVNFEIQFGELVCLLGSSGCGKTTILRLIAGLERATAGEILLEGDLITTPSLSRGMVFQEPRLFPWLTVEDNIAFGLKGRERKSIIQSTVLDLLNLVGLSDFAKALPCQLSGGMAQRVALARSLATSPKILLLDEPFSSLDIQTRTALQTELLHLWKHTNKTCLHVTHDIEEALLLGQRIIIMQKLPGKVVEIIEVPFPYPRRSDDKDFIELKKSILSLYYSR